MGGSLQLPVVLTFREWTGSGRASRSPEGIKSPVRLTVPHLISAAHRKKRHGMAGVDSSLTKEDQKIA